MKDRKLTNFLMSGLLAIAAGCTASYTIASTWTEFRNIRWVSAIAASIGVVTFAGSQAYLNKREVSKNDINKAVLNELRLKLSDNSISPTEAANLQEVIALYVNTVEAQSTDHETTLYQYL
jgi:methionine-rich copper-binding protein CopC